MATTVRTDVKVYEEQFQGGFIETLQQEVNAFNAASSGALSLNTRALVGHYEQEAFWDEISSISRRDSSADSSSTVASTKLTQDEFVSVKLDRRNGPYEVNIDAFRKIGQDAAPTFSRVIGAQTAVATPKEMLDRALAALRAKIVSVAALSHDATGAGTDTIELSDLNTGVSKFGDAGNRIRLFVMHSKPFYDLVGSQITSTASVYASDIFGAQVFAGAPATLGRPVLVTDSTSLVEADGASTGVDQYWTLGLASDAAELVLSEFPIAVMEGPLTGSENLYLRWQAEYSYNLRIKGCQWDTTNGGINPSDAAVATATNWDTVVADNKLLPGIQVHSA